MIKPPNKTVQVPPQNELVCTPGDVLFSRFAIPHPGTILQGFSRWPDFLPQLAPFVSFRSLRELLEFLEFVVTTERLIVPTTPLSQTSKKIASTQTGFRLFSLSGDLKFSSTDLLETLSRAGVVFEAKLEGGHLTADEVVAKRMPTSPALQSKYAHYLNYAKLTKKDTPDDLAKALTAYWVGGPLHKLEAAEIAKVPCVLAHYEVEQLRDFEAELASTRIAVTRILLDRLNAGAAKKVKELAELSGETIFPETPISSMIIQNATSPRGLVDVALQLRGEFAGYRKAMNQLGHDLVNDSLSLKVRLKRAREIKELGMSLWDTPKAGLHAEATAILDVVDSVPEVAANPSVFSISKFAAKLLKLPIEKLFEMYSRRKVRILLKAKRNFLNASDATARIAKIFDVPEDIVRKSRHLNQAPRRSSDRALGKPDK